MTEAEWLTCTDPQMMLKFLQGKGCSSERKLRLFIVSVSRRVWSLLPDEKVRLAVEIAEQFADGLVDEGRLSAALGEDRDSYDWLGGVRDVAHHACRLPGAVDMIHDAARASRLAVFALGRAAFPDADFEHDAYLGAASVREAEGEAHTSFLRCLFGPLPFRSSVLPADIIWKNGAIPKQAQAIYNDGSFDHLPRLAESLENSGCTDADLLAHCRSPRPHVRGCWAVDLLLGKE